MRLSLLCSFFLLFTILFLISSSYSSSSSPSVSFRGIPPQDVDYFKSEIIRCKNESKKFTGAQLNDDFCDCSDGTDEPGTSACPQGKFYCQNAGHFPNTLPSSRVNDGICDCCDGSDEYDGEVKCPNTCWEAGKVSRVKLQKEIDIYKEGVILRRKEIERAKQALAKDKEELSKLKKEKKVLKGLIKQHKGVITLSSSSWLAKIKDTVRTIFQTFKFSFPPVDKLDADRLHKEYDDATTRLSGIEAKISSLTEKLKYDFGTEKEFYFLYDQCFETKQDKYVYKICPFKDAYQEEGYSRTRLGDWENFENSYHIMQFSNGEGCWKGPDRSLKVKLRCGLKTELADMDEPSRCEYEALMTTPVLCLEAELEELKHKLESLYKERPDGHDEL